MATRTVRRWRGGVGSGDGVTSWNNRCERRSVGVNLEVSACVVSASGEEVGRVLYQTWTYFTLCSIVTGIPVTACNRLFYPPC